MAPQGAVAPWLGTTGLDILESELDILYTRVHQKPSTFFTQVLPIIILHLCKKETSKVFSQLIDV